MPLVSADEGQAGSSLPCKVTSFTTANDVNNPAITRLTDAANELNRSVTRPYPPRFNYCLGEREQHSWTNVPGARSGGIRIGDLPTDQQKMVWQLLRNFLGPSAFDNVYLLATDIEEASGAGTVRDYTIAMFGIPGSDSAWGFQFDGHHIALNFVVDANRVILSPAFIGSQPTTLEGRTPLSAEINQGRDFISQLETKQQETAYVQNLVRRDVLVGSGRGQIDQGFLFDVKGFDQIGLPLSSLTEAQKGLIRDLLETYINRLRAEFTGDSLGIIDKHLDSGYFVYSTNGDRLYYRIYVENGILIEYSDVASDHIHTVVRLQGSRPYRDYGGFVAKEQDSTSIITKHLLTAEHHKDDLAEILAISQ